MVSNYFFFLHCWHVHHFKMLLNVLKPFFQAFQQEIYLNTGKIEMVFRQGDALIEKSEPLDAAVIEEELEELQRYCQEVFGRVDRYYKKLTRLPVSNNSNKSRNPSIIYFNSIPPVDVSERYECLIHTRTGGNLISCSWSV